MMNRSSEKNPAKVVYLSCIILGAIMVFTADSVEETYRPYVAIVGFVLLMFGLYKSTTTWTYENSTKDAKKDSFVFMEEEQDTEK